ncbi:MAG: AmmeMemoRadiSam system protein A [Firmicutes bacterium]|nr:AmmeMemoRadiSam system protein A [Bacillota bacterium]
MGPGIVIAALSPHPPIIVPEVGGTGLEDARATVRGMEELSRRIVAAKPDALILVTPHGPVLRDALVVSMAPSFRGDLSRFEAPGVKVELDNDVALAREIVNECSKRGIPAVDLDSSGSLDHGSVVPLYFINGAGLRCPIVSITMAMLDRGDLFEFGRCVGAAARNLGRRAALVASGDLSHRLVPGAPAGYSPSGKKFDELVVKALEEGDTRAILDLDEDLAGDAGECGLRPVVIMLGALDGLEYRPEVISYEGPFGVGYATAVFEMGHAGDGLPARGRPDARPEDVEGDPYVRLARTSLEAYVREGRLIERPIGLPADMNRKAGVFVSLRQFGMLRGCIGTIMPRESDVAREIIRNAVSAGAEDPRFEPVTPAELDTLQYSVDVLSLPEEVAGESALDPRKYGVIVEKGYRRGLLLPDLEGVEAVEQQVSIACQKAGIVYGEKGVKLYRFTVERHGRKD